MLLQFDVALCVRASSKFSACAKCIEASPESLQLVDGLPSFRHNTGVEAAACVGVCPTEAFGFADFSTTAFFFSFVDSKVRLISSKLNVPSLLVLSVEHLIALALACDEPITLDTSGDETDTLAYEQIRSRVEEANFFLSAFSTKRLLTNAHNTLNESIQKEETSRRAFFENASLKGVLRQKKHFDEIVNEEQFKTFDFDEKMIEKMKTKHIPDKRKILLTTLKHLEMPEVFEVFAQEDVGFVSQKFIEEGCTNCQMCYRICPTGALSASSTFSQIHFDAMLCLKCHLCHDVCEPNVIDLQPTFELKALFVAKQKTLAKFTMKRCQECGNRFTYIEGEQVCPRCLLEEEEAMFLHDNAKRMQMKSKEEK